MEQTTAGDRGFLVTYTPLVATAFGRGVSDEHGLPPFIDGSIRREPDLQHQRPSISCLCRGERFVPRLRVGDLVAYVTRRGRYGTRLPTHARLTAVLRVSEPFDTHVAAATWYRDQGQPVPSNCMVQGNDAVPIHLSHWKTKFRGTGTAEQVARRWDAGYRLRARECGRFLACEPLFRDLTWEAPVVHQAHLLEAFGEPPGTQNPGARPVGQLMTLLRLLGIPALPVRP